MAAYKMVEWGANSYIDRHPQGRVYDDKLRILKGYEADNSRIHGVEPYGPFRERLQHGRNGSSWGLGAPPIYDPSPVEAGSKFQPGTKVRGVLPVPESLTGQAKLKALLKMADQSRPADSFGTLNPSGTSNAKRFAAPFGDPGKSTAASLAQSFQPIAASINQGAMTFSTAADGLPAKGSAFGEQAGSGLLGSAGAWGSAAGASLAAAASSIRIGVDAPSKVPNTGSPPPPE